MKTIIYKSRKHNNLEHLIIKLLDTSDKVKDLKQSERKKITLHIEGENERMTIGSYLKEESNPKHERVKDVSLKYWKKKKV